MSGGTIRQNSKVYQYNAAFDKENEKWFGYVVGKSGKISHRTKLVDTYQDAIQLAKQWIVSKLNLM